MSTETIDQNDEKSGENPESEPPKEAVPAASDAKKLGDAPPVSDKAGDDQPKAKKKKKTAEIAISLRKVTKKFGAKVAVDGITLQIKAGSVFGLIGPNGAGKTTTFSMMAGFLRPTEGVIDVLGFFPQQTDMLRSRVGVLPQDAILPPIEKVGEFLTTLARLQMVPARDAQNVARAVLDEVDGRDWWNVKCGALSHGMAKRVQLAQALLGNPDVVLLDEPTAGLDPRSAFEVRQLIKKRRRRCTLVVSSHNLQELEEICDAAAILDHGHVVTSGSMNELTASTQEVHVKIAPSAGTTGAQSVPMAKLRQLPTVERADWDDDRNELIVHFDRKNGDAETVIAHVLWLLLNEKVRISGVTKGRSLEARVMDVTGDEPSEDDDD